MKNKILIGFGTAFAVLVGPLSFLNASDYESVDKEWRLDTGQSESDFKKSVEKGTRGGEQRIVDFELYRGGRNTGTASIWAETKYKEKWLVESGMTAGTFGDSHDGHSKKGFSLVDFEATRIGANLKFAGVWAKAPKTDRTVFYWGMDDLMFSNRYGEMADRGYRLVDYEAYEATAKTMHAGIWVPKGETEVRFYRGLNEKTFKKVAASMKEKGYRATDYEMYFYDKEYYYSCAWEVLKKNEKARFLYDISSESFFQKSTEYREQGYRLIDVEVYERFKELNYAGSWLYVEEVDTSNEPAPIDVYERVDGKKK